LTPERLAEIRAHVSCFSGDSVGSEYCVELLAELDRVRAERDRAIKELRRARDVILATDSLSARAEGGGV